MQTEIPSSHAFSMEALMARSACSAVICTLLPPFVGDINDLAVSVSRTVHLEASTVRPIEVTTGKCQSARTESSHADHRDHRGVHQQLPICASSPGTVVERVTVQRNTYTEARDQSIGRKYQSIRRIPQVLINAVTGHLKFSYSTCPVTRLIRS